MENPSKKQKPTLPRNIRRSIDNINKNMTPEMKEHLIAEAKRADEAAAKVREYHNETQNFISAQGQFLTSIINGWASCDANLGMEAYNTAFKISANMAESYIQSVNAYREKREKEMPDFMEVQDV